MGLRSLNPPTRRSGLVGYPTWSGGPLLDPPEITSGVQWYLTPTNTFYGGGRAPVGVGYGAVEEVRPLRCPFEGDPTYALTSGDQFLGELPVGTGVDERSAYIKLTAVDKGGDVPALHAADSITNNTNLLYIATATAPSGQDYSFTVVGEDTASDVFMVIVSSDVLYFIRGSADDAYIQPAPPISGDEYLFEQALTSDTTGFAKINDVTMGDTQIWDANPKLWAYWSNANPLVIVKWRWAAALATDAPSYAADLAAIKAWAATIGCSIGSYPGPE